MSLDWERSKGQHIFTPVNDLKRINMVSLVTTRVRPCLSYYGVRSYH